MRGSVGLHAGEDMLVGVDGERRVPVTEPLQRDLDGYLGFDEQGGVGVSDVVESDPGDSSSGAIRSKVWDGSPGD